MKRLAIAAVMLGVLAAPASACPWHDEGMYEQYGASVSAPVRYLPYAQWRADAAHSVRTPQAAAAGGAVPGEEAPPSSMSQEGAVVAKTQAPSSETDRLSNAQ